MTEPSASRLQVSDKPPFYRDVTVVKWLVQLATLFALIFVTWFLAREAGDNLRAKGLTSGFEFLGQPAGFNVSEGIDTEPATGGRALWVGMVTTCCSLRSLARYLESNLRAVQSTVGFT